MRYNLTEIIDNIKNRRTITPEKYNKRKVHREQLEIMLEAANWAPTHGKTEPWRFKVFEKESAKALMQKVADIYQQITPENQFLQSKYRRYLQRADLASFIIAICMKRQESKRIPEVEEIEATACAVQNLMLTGAAYGIGTYWSTGKIVYTKQMTDFLQIDNKGRCLGILYVGHPEGEWPKGKRNFWRMKVEWMNEKNSK